MSHADLPRKDGDVFEGEHGVFRVVTPDTGGCNKCDHKEYVCHEIGCGTGDFRLLTEINYLTHRLTK